jgi:plastocyanin
MNEREKLVQLFGTRGSGISRVSLRLLAGVGICAALLPVAVSSTGVRAQATRASAGMTMPAPKTWHVIAGFSQNLPAGNHNTEAVDQFYPRVLTIHPGDKVTWTINSSNEVHTVSFGPDSILRHLEDPQVQFTPKMVNGKMQLVANPAVLFPSARGPLVETDSGSAKTLVNCGAMGPAGSPNAQACTVTFPNLGSFNYDCLLHSGIPGFGDMDGTINVVPVPMAKDNTWTVRAGTGTPLDANDGFVPDHLTIHVGDKVSWVSGGVLFHTVSFGIDPLKTPLFIPVANGPQGPTLAFNPVIATPAIPAGGMYSGGVANSGLELKGNYLNKPGETYVAAPFALTFTKAGTYTYYCLVHGPSMTGTITVLPAGQ